MSSCFVLFFPLNFQNVVIRLQTSRSLHHVSVSFSASVQLETLFGRTSNRPPVCAATTKIPLDAHANDPFRNERHEGMKTFQFLGAKMSLWLALLYILPSAQSNNCRLLIAKTCRKTRCHWQHLQLLFFTNIPGVWQRAGTRDTSLSIYYLSAPEMCFVGILAALSAFLFLTLMRKHYLFMTTVWNKSKAINMLFKERIPFVIKFPRNAAQFIRNALMSLHAPLWFRLSDADLCACNRWRKHLWFKGSILRGIHFTSVF